MHGYSVFGRMWKESYFVDFVDWSNGTIWAAGQNNLGQVINQTQTLSVKLESHFFASADNLHVLRLPPSKQWTSVTY
jgi:hypothetical protein